MTTSVFPTVLHQDPRYFQLGRGSVWQGVAYSVGRIFVSRSDDGAREFNDSEIAGNAVGISISYHPQDQRTLGNTLNLWAPTSCGTPPETGNPVAEAGGQTT